MAYCPKCGAETNGNFCSRCGASLNGEVSASSGSAFTGQQSSAKPVVNASDPAAYKLGWHKFLIYFALWANAALGILNGFGGFLLAEEDSLFAIYGIVNLAVAIFAIYVRFQLAKFKTGAPKKLLIFYGANFLTNLFTVIIDAMSGSSSSASVLVGSAAILVICWRYYSSREALFVH